MCGIAGILEIDNGRQVSQTVLSSMTEALRHRGPDDGGYWVDGSIGLGHRRLAIIDLEGGKQPLSNEDESLWVTYNGEIYNYRELTQELKLKGHRFRTSSDTEVIVHAYEEEGPKAFRRFRGMFSFALWDKPQSALYLVRDPIGIKPLFYYYDSKRLLFASELKSFLLYPDLKLDIDDLALDRYLTYGFIIAPYTIYRNCSKLEPGHYLSLKDGKLDIVSYWDISSESSALIPSTFDDAAYQLREKLRDATSSHLVSDVPVGAFLSGGLDSTTVLALMSKAYPDQVQTFCIGFEDPQYDEGPYAAIASKFFNTQHHYEKVRIVPLEAMKEIVSIFDEPFADSSAIPTFYLSKMTRNFVKVALSGDGGDENFGGYRRYWIDMLSARLRRFIPPALRKFLLSMGRTCEGLSEFQLLRRLSTALKQIGLDEPQAYFHSVSLMKPEEKKRFYHHDFLKSLGETSPFEEFKKLYERFQDKDPLSRMLYTDIKTFLPEDYLTKVDRASMAHGLEVRVPLLDIDLLSYTFFLPSAYKVKGRRSKRLLREALKDVLPEEILTRGKMGFEVPLSAWMRGDLRGIVEDRILRKDSFVCSFLNLSEIQKMWRRFLESKYFNPHLFWALLVLELWHDSSSTR